MCLFLLLSAVECAAELSPALLCDVVVVPEDSEDGDTRLPRSILFVRAVLTDDLDKGAQGRRKVSRGKCTQRTAVLIPRGPVRKSVRLLRLLQQRNDRPDCVGQW